MAVEDGRIATVKARLMEGPKNLLLPACTFYSDMSKIDQMYRNFWTNEQNLTEIRTKILGPSFWYTLTDAISTLPPLNQKRGSEHHAILAQKKL